MILVEPENMYEFFLEHRPELSEESILVAADEVYGIEIFLEAQGGHPALTVMIEDNPEYTEMCVGEPDLRYTASRIYDEYLYNYVNNYACMCLEEEKDNEAIAGEDMFERELDLEDAMCAFLEVALANSGVSSLSLTDDEIQDITDHILEYIARRHQIDIYRPMFLETDDGGEYHEFPYEFIEFEDGDNPVYAPFND